MKLEFYVINHDPNKRKCEMFNIFNNWPLREAVEKEIRKYLRAPAKYKHEKYIWNEDGVKEVTYGFEGFCRRIDELIMWQEWSRCEYEIMVGGLFSAADKYEKWDCYEQAHANIKTICRDILWQYKHQEEAVEDSGDN